MTPSLVADSYLSPCAEPTSSLVNHTTENLLALGIEPSTMSDVGVRMSAVPSHSASLVLSLVSHQLADVFLPSSFSSCLAVAAEEGWKEESLHETFPFSSPPSPTSIAAFSFIPLHQVASQPSQWEV